MTAGSVLAFIGGGFLAMIGLVFAIAGSTAGFQDAVEDQLGPGLGAAVIGIGVVFLVLGALIIFFGVMALKGKRWAAIALAVLAGLSLIGGITDMASGTGSSLVGVAWSVTGAILLLVSSSQAWYRAHA